MVLVSEARSPSAPPEAFPPAVVEPLARSTAVWVNIEGGKPRETEAESLRDRIVKEGEVTVPSLSSSSWEARSFSSSGERGEASSAALPLVVAFAAMSRAPPIRMEGVSLIGRREGKRSRELTRSLKNLKGRAFFFFFFFFSLFLFLFHSPSSGRLERFSLRRLRLEKAGSPAFSDGISPLSCRARHRGVLLVFHVPVSKFRDDARRSAEGAVTVSIGGDDENSTPLQQQPRRGLCRFRSNAPSLV